MILGIDASNIRSGGGLTHLKGILNNANPSDQRIDKIFIWSNKTTLDALPDKDWLVKKTHKYLNKSFLWSFFFQIFFISKLADDEKCKLLFVPGGTFLGTFDNIVSMSRNMLPFEKEERARFPHWKSKLKFLLLKITQSFTFRRSKSVIFLTNYAKDYITKDLRLKNYTIIPHGINTAFLNQPKPQKNIKTYTKQNPFKLLYVSIVTVYKHQWNVAEAVLKLKKEGYPIRLDLVGDSTDESILKLQEVMKNDDDNSINYHGVIQYEKLSYIYKSSDAFVFASSCENMPNILVEAMTAGLPIACSDRGPMPEVLGSNGFYFNPLDADDIYKALKNLLENETLREEQANQLFEKSINYTWKDCADKTFIHLAKHLYNENSK